MNQAPPGETTSLQTSLDAITMILQRKVNILSQKRPAKKSQIDIFVFSCNKILSLYLSYFLVFINYIE